MAISSQTLTLEAFLRLPEEEPALEYMDGVVTQKVSPNGKHVVLQDEFAGRVNAVGRPRRLARAFRELRVTFAGASVVPDVSVYRWERIPRDVAGLVADDFYEPPDLTLEIVSPGQSVTALMRRCLWYVANGVQIALLAVPADRSVVAFRAGQEPVIWEGQDRIDIEEIVPGVVMTVEDLYVSLLLD